MVLCRSLYASVLWVFAQRLIGPRRDRPRTVDHRPGTIDIIILSSLSVLLISVCILVIWMQRVDRNWNWSTKLRWCIWYGWGWGGNSAMFQAGIQSRELFPLRDLVPLI